MPQCFDINNVPQDCASASDVGGSSCFDDNGGQEVSCAEVGGYADPNAVPTPTNAQTTGLLAASSRNGSTALSTPIVQLGAIAAQTYATTQAPASNAVRIGPTGIAIPQASLSTGLLVAIVAVAAFLIWRGSK
jgi:hypothetical protein